MTGEEAKAIILEAFGTTKRGAEALSISRRKLCSLYTLDRIPALYRLALKEVQRAHRTPTGGTRWMLPDRRRAYVRWRRSLHWNMRNKIDAGQRAALTAFFTRKNIYEGRWLSEYEHLVAMHVAKSLNGDLKP